MTWTTVENFRNYEVSDGGEIRNKTTRKVLKPAFNQQGIPFVTLRRDNESYSRTIPKMVAEHFLPDPPFEHFDTPINLNGDRSDCDVENLMWRPRWFAVKYHKQFDGAYFLPNVLEGPLHDTDGNEYKDSFYMVLDFGVLNDDVREAVTYGTFIFPTKIKMVSRLSASLLERAKNTQYSRRDRVTHLF